MTIENTQKLVTATQFGALGRELAEYLRAIREEKLDGSEPGLKELLARADAIFDPTASVAVVEVPSEQVEALAFSILDLRDSASGDGCEAPYMVIDANTIDAMCAAALPIVQAVRPATVFMRLAADVDSDGEEFANVPVPGERGG